ncbi:lamin tail domain-containing protein [Streptomyces sp. HPF1205]|uniref:lamin tail domain-containing protein n=1 Tax=Streptomyces sp. HPF1205 TaxID=2873262 RepID=UPI001CEDC764|nr:lamin tail domain-containing protein [Streptomyces sp. HPF1205]
MHRFTAVAAACLTTAVAALGLATAGPAQAAGSVHLSEIYYNSPGSDTGSNASLNAEWVKITNSTTRSADLTGWTLTDASRHTYRFGSYRLGAGKSVYVHTGRGGNTALNRYQGRSWYVWNNDKDTATLRRSTGTRVDVCAYSNSHRSYVYC